jgi:lipid A 3-O-deacylase
LRVRSWLGIAACAAVWTGAPAGADVRDIRLAMVKHNFLDEHKREDSENIEGEIDWDSPHILKIIGAPRPYAMVSVNDQGFTSFAAIGFNWRKSLGSHWALEPSFGYAIHNGKLDVPFPAGDPRNIDFDAERVLLGSRELFRESLALEREMGPRLATQIYYEHLSNGQLLGARRNQGLDEIGLRLVWRVKHD